MLPDSFYGASLRKLLSRPNHTFLMDMFTQSGAIGDIWRESSFAEVLYGLIVEEGYAKCRGDGRAEGRVAGMRQAARVALEGRFGALDADILAALNAANEQVLLEIIAGLTSETLQRVRQRLGLAPE